MLTEQILRLQYLCDTIPALLLKIDENDFVYKSAPEKWSKKEILGHLIDSAANNHQRFVRVQFEDLPDIQYDQNKWNQASAYNQINSKHLISFWESYNRHLIEIIRLIPGENMTKECETGMDNPVTLHWLINDYVVHLEHHLHELVEY